MFLHNGAFSLCTFVCECLLDHWQLRVESLEWNVASAFVLVR